MIDRRTALIFFAAALLPAGIARAQPAKSVSKLGILFAGTEASATAYFDAFFTTLAAQGFIEGRSLRVERRFAEGHAERLEPFARELVALKVDAIYAPPTPAALAAKKASMQIPVVFSMAPDPVAVGLVKSLARPGGNVTGVSTLGLDIAPKRIQLLRELMPSLRKVGLLIDTSREQAAMLSKVVARKAAEAARLEVVEHDVSTREQVTAAFGVLRKKGVEAVLVFEGSLAFINRAAVIAQAAQYRMPAIYAYPDLPADGGLISYSANYVNQYQRAALVVASILKGAKPADIPVEQPNQFELVINMKTAHALGLKVPQSILVQATKVIE